MKRTLITIAALLFVMYGVYAAYRAVRIPELPTAPPDITAPDTRGPLPMLAFAAGPDARFLAVFTRADHTAILLTAAGPHTLAAVPAASGARYADDTYTLWIHGEDVSLEVAGVAVGECRPTGRQRVLERLWATGTHLVAAGQEPDWILTVGPDETVLTEGGNATARVFNATARVFTPGLSDLPPGLAPLGSYELADSTSTAVLHLEPGACIDTMQGEPFACEAVLEVDGRRLVGCALGLRP